MANQENIRKWVEALRSGEYQQATGQLMDAGGYCCLGVACHISEVGEWNEFSEYVTEDPDDGFRTHESTALPKVVVDWLGLDSDNPSLDFDGQKMTAIGANDDYGKTFEEIADALERTYLAA